MNKIMFKMKELELSYFLYVSKKKHTLNNKYIIQIIATDTKTRGSPESLVHYLGSNKFVLSKITNLVFTRSRLQVNEETLKKRTSYT
jgi:hypothetical protein